MSKQEQNIHIAFARYVQHQYPFAIFTSEASGIRVPISIAKYLKATRNPKEALPDFWLLFPSQKYHAFLLEIKKDRNEVYTKKGELRNNKHIQKQYELLEKLRQLGYYAEFGLGIEDCISKIDEYMKS